MKPVTRPARWLSACFCLFLGWVTFPAALAGQKLDRIKVGQMRNVWYTAPTSKTDPARFQAGIYLLNVYDEFNPDSLLYIAKEMRAYGVQTGRKLWVAQSWHSEGKYYYGTVGNTDKAISAYQTALRYLESADTLFVIKVHGSLGVAFTTLNQLDSAQYHLTYAVDIARRLPPTSTAANIFGSLAKCYELQGNYIKAIELNTESKKREGASAQYISTYNTGVIFKKLGLPKEALEQFWEALEYAKQSDIPRNVIRSYAARLQVAGNVVTAQQYLEEGLSLADSLKQSRPTLFLLSEAGQLFLDSMRLDLAGFYLNKCLRLATQLKDQDSKNRSILLLAQIQCIQGAHKQALQACLTVQSYFEKNNGGENLITLYDVLSKSYEALGQTKRALFFLQKKDHTSAAFNNTATVKEQISAFLTFKNQEEQKILLLGKEKAEAQAATLKAGARLNLLVTGLLGLLLVAIVVFFFIFYRLKARAAGNLVQANIALQSEKVKLEHSNARLRQFSSVVSHDILSNLDLILSTGNIFVGNKPKPEGLLRYYQMVHQTSAQLKMYCQKLLDEARNMPQTARMDPNPVVQAVYRQYEPALQQKNFQVTIEPLPLSPLPPAVVEQLFHNLISNVLRHGSTATLPLLHIDGTTDANGLPCWVIEDNGPGIPESQMTAIFQGMPTNHDSNGQKIGLSLLKQTLREYDADIRAEQRPGGGARFVVAFGKNV